MVAGGKVAEGGASGEKGEEIGGKFVRHFDEWELLRELQARS